jgi:hypothetical protein
MRRLCEVLPFGVLSPNAAGCPWARLLCLLLVPAIWFGPVPDASAASATSTPQTGIAVEGQLGGYAAALAAGGTSAYLALGPRVAVVDTTNPAMPRLLGQSPLLPGDVQHLAVSGPTLVAAYQPPSYPNLPTGLATFDVGNPSTPLAEGRFSLPNRVDALAIAGSVAYVAMGSSHGTGGSVWAIDLRNAANPQRLGQYLWPENTAAALAVAGSTVYLLLGDTMRLVSFANPAQPALLATTTLPALASGPSGGRAIAVTGSVLTVTQGMVGERSNGVGVLRTYDISDPRHPRPLGLLTGFGYPSNGLAVTNQTAYVAANDGIHVIDLGDPGQPRQLAVLAGNPQASALAWSGSALVVLQGGATPLAVVNVAHPAQPQVVGTLPDVTGVQGLALAGTTLSLSNSVSSLDVLDVSDPSRPALRSRLSVPGGIAAQAAAPSYVYAVGGPQTRNRQFVPGILTLVDVADPARPALVGPSPSWGTTSTSQRRPPAPVPATMVAA